MEDRLTRLEDDQASTNTLLKDIAHHVGMLRGIAQSQEHDIRTLKSDVSGLKSDILGLKSDVSGLKSDVAGIKSDVSGLKSDVAGIKSDVAGLKSDVAGIKEEMRTGFASIDIAIRQLAAQVSGLAQQTRTEREN